MEEAASHAFTPSTTTEDVALTGVRSTQSNLDARVASATRRLSQVVASQLLRDRAAALKAKRAERQAMFRRKILMGDAVFLAGLAEWEPAEIVGALLDAKDRFGDSPTQRMGLRQRGEQRLKPNQGKRRKPSDDESRGSAV